MRKGESPDRHLLPGYAAVGRLLGSRGELESRLSLLGARLAAELSGCGWCIGRTQHQGLKSGLPQKTLEAVRDWATSALFTEREQAALGFVEAVSRYSAREGGIARQVMARIERQFSRPEIAELTAIATAEHFFDPATGALGAETGQ